MVGSALISGLGLGSMYGLLALGFYVTYAVSSTVNFAQGSSMMLGAVFAYTFSVRFGWPFAAAALMALVLCALYGLLVELVAVRPFASRGSSAWLMATVALGIVADNTVLFTFGKEPRGLALLRRRPRPPCLACTCPRCRWRFPPSASPWRRCCTGFRAIRGTARQRWRWCRTRTPHGSWESMCRSPSWRRMRCRRFSPALPGS